LKKRALFVVLVVVLFSTSIVFAASVNGTFAGLPIVNVKVNNDIIKSSVPGVVLQGSTLLPARAIAENLNAVVSWDQATMTASIKQYNVDMCFVQDIAENSDGSWQLKDPYGIASIGQDQSILIYYEIGPIEPKNYEYRFLVEDPNGNALATSTTENFDIASSGMDGYIQIDNLNFTAPGNYDFNLQLKLDGEFKTIGDKLLVVE